MKRRLGLGLALAICAVAEAAEPASTAPASVDAAIPVRTLAAAKPAPAKPAAKSLNLSIRDVRNYMMPRELAEVLGAPNADENTVLVETSVNCCR